MEPFIDPIPKEILEAELKPEFFIRKTNKAGNEIYIVRAVDTPQVMKEIGRLREMSFRAAGGGTGKAVDIDLYDTHPQGYLQLIVWDHLEKEILGGYRYIIPGDTNNECISTELYFKFSDRFRQEYLPYTIELGRSFVQPKYQVRGSSKALFALDNLWDGLGSVVEANTKLRYIFGKVTMYEDYNVEARSMLLWFLKLYFPDRQGLMTARHPIEMKVDEDKIKKLFSTGNYTGDYKILKAKLKELGEIIPPMINSYMQLSPTMMVFDTAKNPDFGDVEETGILITINDIYTEKVIRHFESGQLPSGH